MENKKKIIDVRQPEQFAAGHAEGSTNIPLQEMENRLEEVKELKGELVLCCGGGTRSGKATELLRSHGIACENGGSWKTVHDKINNGDL